MKLHEFEMDTRSNPAQKLNKDLENGVQWQLKSLKFEFVFRFWYVQNNKNIISDMVSKYLPGDNGTSPNLISNGCSWFVSSFHNSTNNSKVFSVDTVLKYNKRKCILIFHYICITFSSSMGSKVFPRSYIMRYYKPITYHSYNWNRVSVDHLKSRLPFRPFLLSVAILVLYFWAGWSISKIT